MNSVINVDNLGKKCYLKPQLITYGDLRELTQSGTGSKSEAGQPRPGGFKICIPDPAKKC